MIVVIIVAILISTKAEPQKGRSNNEATLNLLRPDDGDATHVYIYIYIYICIYIHIYVYRERDICVYVCMCIYIYTYIYIYIYNNKRMEARPPLSNLS